MEPMYVYGGYILTGGKLDDGKPWEGINILLAEVRKADELPLAGMIGKARRDPALLDTLNTLTPGVLVHAPADLRGKVTSISVVQLSKPEPDILYATEGV